MKSQEKIVLSGNGNGENRFLSFYFLFFFLFSQNLSFNG